MKKGWQIKPLGEIANVSAGNSAPQDASLFDGGIHPFFRTSDIGRVRFGNISDAADHLNDDGIRGLRRFPAGTILFPKSGASTFLNHRVMLSVDGFVSSHLATIAVDSERANARFVLFYLSTVAAQDLIQDHAYPSLNLPAISAIPIPLPPLPEQKRIVGILDEAFAGIATAKENAERNLQNARDLFESHLNAVFSQRGEGWVEKQVGEVCTLKSGTTWDKSLEHASGEVPYVKVSDMSYEGNETEVVASSRYVNRCDISVSAILPPGTTIFPKRGGAILTNKKRITAVPICTDLNIMGAFPRSTGLLPKFVFFYFCNVDMRQLGSGSSIPQINNYDIAPLALAFPRNTSEQATVVRTLESLSDQADHLESVYQQKLDALDALKKSLLHQAFAGGL